MPAYSVTEYMNLPAPSTVWVWKGIIPVGGATLLFGHPKTGKSKLVLGLAEAIADPNIKSFLGLDIQTHGPVLYVQLDTPRNLWKGGYLEFVRGKVARDNMYMIDREMEDKPNPFDICDMRCQEWVATEVRRLQPVLVIIDTVRRMHRGDENDPTVMALVYDTFVNITTPSAMCLLAHKKKQQHGDDTPGQARGSSVLMGAVDSLVNMTRDCLYIEARSDVDEEIHIQQQDDGTFQLDQSDPTAIRDFIAAIDPALSKKQANELIMAEFGISERTAKRYRSKYK